MRFEANCNQHKHFTDRSSPRMTYGSGHKRARCSAKSWRCPLPQSLKTGFLVATILVALCVEGSAQQSLSANEIEDRIIGHNFQGRKGILSVSLQYGNDGTVVMHSPLGTGTGRWTLAGDRLCIKLDTGPRKMDECLAFVSKPDGTYRTSNGIRLIPVE